MDKCVKRLGMGITSGKAAKAVENQRARKLYEEIFDEDSPAFVDYYFRVKAAENEIFVVENEEQEILATLHLNPYKMMFCGEKAKTNYIVAGTPWCSDLRRSPGCSSETFQTLCQRPFPSG